MDVDNISLDRVGVFLEGDNARVERESSVLANANGAFDVIHTDFEVSDLHAEVFLSVLDLVHIDINVGSFSLKHIDIGADGGGVRLELGQTNVQFLASIAALADNTLDGVDLHLLVLNVDVEAVVVVHERGDVDLDIVSLGDQNVNIGLEGREGSLAGLPLSIDGSDTFVKAHQSVVERGREVLNNENILFESVRAHFSARDVDIDSGGRRVMEVARNGFGGGC